ncbi:type VI secretion system baseplate subunit TssG [Pseudomonas sp. SCB32]|uniref:type VI secretion system baseplate subunit TssG n=1 Tax=Pseudomonas sp. SCB32 TaxID=2653853 RepID=UPI0012643066|nr:type VI secretion system baseplate subunit TssG [Pseudomonas sp. SCB32]
MNLPTDSRAQCSSQLQQKLQEAPEAFDLFQLLRRIDAQGDHPPLGSASRPREEPLRIGQEPSLAFASSEIFQARIANGRPHLSILGFGLFGPNGPLPLHLTEYARERKHHHGDATLCAFADLFHHRLTLLFYRSWAQAEAAVSLDRDQQGYVHYLACLLQLGGRTTRQRDALAHHAKLAMAGHLVRQTRNPEGLERILQSYFAVGVRVQEHISARVEQAPSAQVRIGRHASQLGGGELLGRSTSDAQSRFRLVLGPMPWSRLRDFLPGTPASLRLRDWVRQYIGLEYAWDVRLLLQRDTIPGARLGSHSQIGYGTWLGCGREDGHAEDLLYDPERYWRNQESSPPHLERNR